MDRSLFTESDEEVAQLFANQAAVAIQDARLYEQIQIPAVETEQIRQNRAQIIAWATRQGRNAPAAPQE